VWKGCSFVSETNSPPSSIQLVWEPALCQALGRSRYTIRRWIDQGIIPKPIAITEQSRAWRLRDIEAALDRLARTRRTPKRRGSLMQGDELVHTPSARRPMRK